MILGRREDISDEMNNFCREMLTRRSGNQAVYPQASDARSPDPYSHSANLGIPPSQTLAIMRVQFPSYIRAVQSPSDV